MAWPERGVGGRGGKVHSATALELWGHERSTATSRVKSEEGRATDWRARFQECSGRRGKDMFVMLLRHLCGHVEGQNKQGSARNSWPYSPTCSQKSEAVNRMRQHIWGGPAKCLLSLSQSIATGSGQWLSAGLNSLLLQGWHIYWRARGPLKPLKITPTFFPTHWIIGQSCWELECPPIFYNFISHSGLSAVWSI